MLITTHVKEQMYFFFFKQTKTYNDKSKVEKNQQKINICSRTTQ